MDLGTGLAVLGSAKILEKLLGPTADYIGAGAKDWTQRRVENVNRIFAKAAKKLGSNLDQPGAVPPRVIEGVVNQGSFCDDELGAEYFGGVLASSRSETPRDDRGAALNALISRLSSYQLRAHYVFYSLVRRLFSGKGLTLTLIDRPQMAVYMSYDLYQAAMQFSDEENRQFTAILEHVCFGLSRESLIETFHYGDPEHLKPHYPAIPGRGLVVQPSVLGAELFLWAHGYRATAVSNLLDPTVGFDVDVSVPIPDGAVAAR